jgi:hypothetical protein
MLRKAAVVLFLILALSSVGQPSSDRDRDDRGPVLSPVERIVRAIKKVFPKIFDEVTVPKP